jgi:hypothetical protein
VGTKYVFFAPLTSFSWLKPYFGIEPSQQFQPYPVTDPVLRNLEPNNPFLSGIGTSYSIGGNQNTLAPLDSQYNPGDLLGTTLMDTQNLQTVVHYWQGPFNDAVYLSFMPEHGGNSTDRQLLYNALTVPAPALATLTQQGPASIGFSFGLSLSSSTAPNAPYAIALALGSSPGIPLLDGRSIPLRPDALFWLSLAPGSNNFVHMTGTLDGQGNAPIWAVLLVPNNPALINATVFAAAVTFDPMLASGIGRISQALPITIQ